MLEGVLTHELALTRPPLHPPLRFASGPHLFHTHTRTLSKTFIAMKHPHYTTRKRMYVHVYEKKTQKRFNPDLLELIPASQLDADFGGEHHFEFEPESYWDQIVT